MGTFGRNFLLGYEEGRRRLADQQRQKQDQEEFALRREQFERQIKIQEQASKVADIERRQQDAKDRLAFLAGMDRPQVPVSPDAGGVGPPAEVQREVVDIPFHGGAPLSVPAQYRGDIEARQLEGLEQTQQVETKGALGRATALGERPIRLSAPTARFLGVSGEVTAQELPILTEMAQQREISRRAAAERAERDKGDYAPEQLRLIADDVYNRRINPTTLKKETFERVVIDLKQRGLAVPRPLTGTEVKVSGVAESGAAAIRTMRDIHKRNPNVLWATAAPGGALGTRAGAALTGVNEDDALIFNVARNRAMNPEMRIDTGAALNKDEQVFYRRLEPVAGDTPAAVDYKLRQQEALYLSLSGKQFTIKMPDGRTFDITDGFDFKQRSKMRDAIRQGGDVVY